MKSRLSISNFRSCYSFFLRRSIYIPTLPTVTPADKRSWSYEDNQIYTLIKAKKFRKALPIIDQLRKDRTPIAPPLLCTSLHLYLELGPHSSGLRDILSYLNLTSLHIYIEKMAPVLIERAVIQKDSQSIVQILDMSFMNEIPIRMTSFTEAIELLAQSRNYVCVQGYLTQYLDLGYNIEEKLLEVVCTEFLFFKSPYLLHSLLLILVYYTKRHKFIHSLSVFNKLADCLQTSGQFSTVKRTFLSDDKCFNCGTYLALASLTPKMYSTLEAGVRESIAASLKGGLSLDLVRLDYTVKQFIMSLGRSDAPGVIVDATSTAKVVNTGLDHVHINDMNIASLLSLVNLVRRETKCAGVLVAAKAMTLFKHKGSAELRELNEGTTTHLLNKESSHFLYALLATVKLRSRGLLITNQTYSASLHAFPANLRPLYMSWYINHVIRSGFTGAEPNLYRISRTQWRPEFSDVSLHIPMADNNWICAQAKEADLDT